MTNDELKKLTAEAREWVIGLPRDYFPVAKGNLTTLLDELERLQRENGKLQRHIKAIEQWEFEYADLRRLAMRQTVRSLRFKKALHVMREGVEAGCYCERLHPDFGGECNACEALAKADAILKVSNE
jgi:uncharacterized protein (UPF0335 family)